LTVGRQLIRSIRFGRPLGRGSLVLIGVHFSKLVEVIYTMHCFVLPFPFLLFPRSLPCLLLLLLVPFLLHLDFPSSLPLKSLQFFFLLRLFRVLFALLICSTGPVCSVAGLVQELDPAFASWALIGFASTHIVMVFIISDSKLLLAKRASFWFHVTSFVVIAICILRS